MSVGSRRYVFPVVDRGLFVVMVREGLQESGFESFVAGVSPRSEELRIIYNALNRAGVVHA
jgi:hypothetical protein